MEAWLCPALLKYFEAPSKEIFVQVRRNWSFVHIFRDSTVRLDPAV